MSKKTICFAVIAVLLVIGITISQEAQGNKPTAERHKDRGVACAVCHDGESAPKTAAAPKSCLMCHESLNAVAEKTREYKFNPHRNHITESNDLECTQCHQGHKDDTTVCFNCHQGMKFK